MVKKGELYYPSKELKNKAWFNNEEVYKRAEKDPLKFRADLAEKLFWFKKWKKTFIHKPPYFQWFVGGKINTTVNIFEKNRLGWDNIKNKTAIIWEPEPLEEKTNFITYNDLYQEVNRLANGLKELGVKKGDRVGIYLPMIPEAIIAMLSCVRIGAIHSVVFSAFSPKALQVRLQDTAAKVLITADSYYRRGKLINLKENADQGIKETKVKKVIVVKRSDGKNVVWKKGRDIWWHELLKKQSNECEAKVMDAEDTLFILYTSGSTGKPKGCVHVCGGYTVQAYNTSKWIFDLHKEDILWSTADLGWITGHTYSCYGPLLNGATFVIFEGAPDWPKPDRWAQIIEKNKVTIFYTAPTAIRMFKKYDSDLIKKYNFSSLRILASVGEPIDEDSWNWYFKEIGKEKCPILDTWWQTETGGVLITALPGIGPFKPCFTGRPLPGLKFDILDDKGNSLPKNKTGNLVLLPPFTPGLLRNIYKNPKKYSKTYWSQYGDKIYYTSDGAYKNSHNLIRIIGRMDDVIKVAGHRLATGELEDSISKISEVSECAVVGIPDEIKGEVPVAFVSLKKKTSLDEIKEKIKNQLRKEIGPIASVKEIYLVKDLPKTRSGKIMRRILKRLFTGEELGDLSTLANPESVGQIKDNIII